MLDALEKLTTVTFLRHSRLQRSRCYRHTAQQRVLKRVCSCVCVYHVATHLYGKGVVATRVEAKLRIYVQIAGVKVVLRM